MIQEKCIKLLGTQNLHVFGTSYLKIIFFFLYYIYKQKVLQTYKNVYIYVYATCAVGYYMCEAKELVSV